MARLKNSRKLLTLNTHSFMEQESGQKLKMTADMIAEEAVDVAAFQEVNQSMGEELADPERLSHSGFCRGELEVNIKSDNYGLLLAEELLDRGEKYYWTWAPSHIGYNRFDEGIALFSKFPILEIRTGYVSETEDFTDPHARMVVGIRVRDGGGSKSWYYSVHLSRWIDGVERFDRQWGRLEEMVKEGDADKENEAERSRVWILGDFNSPAQDLGEGYSFVLREDKWKDCFVMAGRNRATVSLQGVQKIQGIERPRRTEQIQRSGGTVRNVIDGWRDTGRQEIRIDYIMVNREVPISECKTVFDGVTYPVVSDHYGVMANVELG